MNVYAVLSRHGHYLLERRVEVCGCGKDLFRRDLRVPLLLLSSAGLRIMNEGDVQYLAAATSVSDHKSLSIWVQPAYKTGTFLMIELPYVSFRQYDVHGNQPTIDRLVVPAGFAGITGKFRD